MLIHLTKNPRPNNNTYPPTPPKPPDPPPPIPPDPPTPPTPLDPKPQQDLTDKDG